MVETSLDVQAGFLPYADGSGFEVAVTLRDRGDGPKLSIGTTFEFDANKWPEVRNGIERMLRVLPAGTAQ